ncbi:MAG: hypothetical protein JXA91_07740 [Candidatus Thermoplasmatota archaeon]|nr:hypothetical protein [Candidatus Thermoplasmatota archaeon]
MEGQIKNRLLAIFVVAILLLSTLMVINTTMAETYTEIEIWEKIPGETAWTGCSATTVGAGASENASVLNMSTSSLYYGNTVNIYVNGSAGLDWTAGVHYLYYPIYKGDLGETYNLTWSRWKPETGPTPTIDYSTGDWVFENIYLNRTGLWLIDDDNWHDASNFSNMNDTIPAWFWVNTSELLTITTSVSSIDYGQKTPITITVKKGGEAYPALIDVRAFSGAKNNETVFTAGNAWTSTGTFTFQADTTNFSRVDTYYVYAYRDIDPMVTYYKESEGKYYSPNYGKGYSNIDEGAVDFYNYSACGPWDPPEYNESARKAITVKKAKPTITATNLSEVYWGYEARIDVNITNAYGTGLANLGAVKVKNREGKYFDNETEELSLWIAKYGEQGNYSIIFNRSAALWMALFTTYANGTWRIYYGEDIDGDGYEEWNNSISFSVKSKAPAVRLDIVNDGQGAAKDMKIDIPAMVNTGAGTWENGTTNISFIIYGGAVSGVKAYYGDDPGENKENISITGDILHPPILFCPGMEAGGYKWFAHVTPTKPGGTIRIMIDWPENGTDKETINIVNGTTVIPSIDSFTVDENVTLTLTIKSLTGSLLEYANVTLFWGDWDTSILDGGSVGDVINGTNGAGTAGKGLNGEYTFVINKTQQRDIAPQNITIAAKTPSVDYWGYAQVLMDRNHDFVVNCTPTTAYAGQNVEYDITIRTLDGGTPEEDSTLYIKLYNETGALVTDIDAWSEQATADITEEIIPLSGGTYYLYAYNDTHDSKGHNATIVVTPYTVQSDPTVLAWLIDEETNMTFSVTPAGNGTLTIKNMSGLPNASSVGDQYDVEINNGVGTLAEVNATTLGNITFWYTPEEGVSRKAVGLVRVTTATATPTPATVYIGYPTTVTILVTHPATGVALPGVRVALDYGKNLTSSLLIKIPDHVFTDSEGKARFSIETGGSGNVTIYLKNQSDPENKFVIKSAAKKEAMIDADPSANEGATFTVEVKKLDGTLVTDTTVSVIFNGETKTSNTGSVTFTAPTVPDSLDYKIRATAEGYTIGDTTIKIINVPQLVVAVTMPASGKITTNSQFDVTIADDMGSAIIGATVTFNSATFTSGAGGKVTLTAPGSAGTYNIGATKTGFLAADSVSVTVESGGIPGFELVTLIAAIGIAFILIRRRRQ